MRSESKFHQFPYFAKNIRFWLVAAYVSLVLFTALPAYARPGRASARLTVEVVVMPTLQGNVTMLMNSGTARSVNGVMFDFVPDSSRQNSSQINVQSLRAEPDAQMESTTSSDREDEAILQTLTVTTP